MRQDPCQALTMTPSANLPEPSYTGVLTCYVSREIDAPLETVWEVLSDFTKYSEWSVCCISCTRGVASYSSEFLRNPFV